MNFTLRLFANKMNRLSLEKSPYLLQHKSNPINWYPWGQDAFQHARLKNIPIFLSVGYSTCHWCHVMEKESFENLEIAEILNKNFVSIKVDREERPDVDKLYMEFIVATTGHGGWPMNVFLAPENLAPITGGTYFPPDDSRGMLGFPSILKMISEEWQKDADGLKNQGKILLELMGKTEQVGNRELPETEKVFEAIYSHKAASFDERFGGFGRAPKFPKCSDLDFLINYASSQKSDQPEKSQNTVRMLKKTLESMGFGGIHDHIGKGFHRYSVDAEWHIPHFEKMLYDQAQLLASYSDFYRMESSPEIRQIIQDIYEYLIENLQHPEGGFYSAEDADSFPQENSPRKIEGAFATWTRDEISRVLVDEVEREIFCEYFDVREEGNLPGHAEAEMGKLKNCLRRLKSDAEVAESFGVSVDELRKIIGQSKEKMLAARRNRPAPHLDSKIVCSWQGLSISGLVKAFQALGNEEILENAEKCWDFVERYLLENETGELRRAVYLGEENCIEMGNSQLAFSDDYAFLIQGLLDLYTVTGNDKYLKSAENLQTKMDGKFWNSENGGYFISAENPEMKIRICENQDGAEPCATSIATLNLLRFYEILELEKYRESAGRCLIWAGERLEKIPIALPKLALAHQRWQNGAHVFVLVGEPESELLELARKFLNQKFIANSTVVHICETDTLSSSGVSHSAMFLGQKPAVYICSGFVCGKPIRNLDELRQKFERDY